MIKYIHIFKMKLISIFGFGFKRKLIASLLLFGIITAIAAALLTLFLKNYNK
jgi:hypothetical protein